MCSLFHLSFGNENGGVQLVYESTCCLAWGVILDRRKDRGVDCVFSTFNAGGSVCGCICDAHTHTLWWVTADRWLRATSTPSSKKLYIQEGEKDKLFADHVTQVCEAHNRVIVSFLQQVQGGTRPTTEG